MNPATAAKTTTLLKPFPEHHHSSLIISPLCDCLVRRGHCFPIWMNSSLRAFWITEHTITHSYLQLTLFQRRYSAERRWHTFTVTAMRPECKSISDGGIWGQCSAAIFPYWMAFCRCRRWEQGSLSPDKNSCLPSSLQQKQGVSPSLFVSRCPFDAKRFWCLRSTSFHFYRTCRLHRKTTCLESLCLFSLVTHDHTCYAICYT